MGVNANRFIKNVGLEQFSLCGLNHLPVATAISSENAVPCQPVIQPPRAPKRLNQQHLALPLLAEGRVYFFGKEGKCAVLKAGNPFEKLAENLLEGTLGATPAIVGQANDLRTGRHPYRIGRE